MVLALCAGVAGLIGGGILATARADEAASPPSGSAPAPTAAAGAAALAGTSAPAVPIVATPTLAEMAARLADLEAYMTNGAPRS